LEEARIVQIRRGNRVAELQFVAGQEVLHGEERTRGVGAETDGARIVGRTVVEEGGLMVPPESDTVAPLFT
jgi:hypothetical protein